VTSVSIEVERRAIEVFGYATDPTKFHEWQQGVVSGSLESEGAPTVGDRCMTTRRIGGAERPATSELVQFDPPRAWAVRGTDGPIRAHVDVSVEALADERSRLTIAVDFEGHDIGKGAGAPRRATTGPQRDAWRSRQAQTTSRDTTGRVNAAAAATVAATSGQPRSERPHGATS
jgi:hypothetical protein